MAGEQLNLEFVVKVLNETKAGIDSVIADYRKLGTAAVGAEKAGAPIGGTQQQQRMSGLHTRITQLTTGFRKLGIEMETIDLYFISGFKVVGLFKLLEFAKQSVFAFENMRKGLLGVQLATEQAGFEMEDSLTSINNLLKMGRVGAEDLSEAMRNLLKKGFAPSESQFLVESLIKSGTVFGTQANMPLAEAVKRATEGILLDLSRLVDATRLTKNLDQMWAEYARTIGKTVDALDEHEKRQAVIQYFIKENIGLTEKYAQANTGVTAALGEFAVTFDKLKRGVGEGLAIPVTWAVKGTTSLLEGLMIDLGLLGSAIKANNIAISIPVELVWATGGGFAKGWFSELFKSFQEIRLNPHDIRDNPISQSFDSAKEKLHELSYAVDDFYATTFGRESAIYKLIGMGKIDVVINPVIDREKFQAFSGADLFKQHLGNQMWWNKPEEGFTIDFGKMIDKANLEQARAWGTKLANAFSQPLERGISDVFFGIFTGEKGSIVEMAKNFGRSLARAISDALAEAIMMPVKNVFQGLFTTIGTSLFKSAVPTGGNAIPDVRGFDSAFASTGKREITINIGSGYTSNEIGAMVTREVQESYSRNSAIRKVVKGQR